MSFPTLGNKNRSLHSCVVLLRMLYPTLRNKSLSLYSYIVFLMISSKLLIACNFLSPMDANGASGVGFATAYVKSISTLVTAS